MEIAGLLLGVVNPNDGQPDTVRILAQIPFEIEYAQGPVFFLSALDSAYLQRLIDNLATADFLDGTEASGCVLLGFYVSHSRSSMALTDAELALFEQRFPHAWLCCC